MHIYVCRLKHVRIYVTFIFGYYYGNVKLQTINSQQVMYVCTLSNVFHAHNEEYFYFPSLFHPN